MALVRFGRANALLLLICVLSVLLIGASSARAADKVKLPNAAQPWISDDVSQTPYQDFLPPISDPKVRESTGFACFYPTDSNRWKGYSLPASPSASELVGPGASSAAASAALNDQKRGAVVGLGGQEVPGTALAQFRRLVTQAATIYDFADDTQKDTGIKPGVAMENFLWTLKNRGFISKLEIETTDGDRPIGIENSDKSNRLDYPAAEGVRYGPQVQALINVTDDPKLLLKNVEALGCALTARVSDSGQEPTLGLLFDDFPLFLVSIQTYSLNKLSEWVYNSVMPPAFKFSFFTPHVERGETFFSVFGNGGDADNAKVQRVGFDESLTTDKAIVKDGDTAVWIKMSLFLRYFLSTFYLLILLVGAVIYMVRGSGFEVSARKRRSVLDMIPRMGLSIILLLVGPAVVGGMITVSNLVTQSLFSIDATCTSGSLSDDTSTPVYKQIAAGTYEVAQSRCDPRSNISHIVSQVYHGDTDSNSADAVGLIVQTLTLLAMAVVVLLMVITALIRQAALIVLVALMPVAAFLFIFHRGQEMAIRWMKATIACCLIPVAMAIIVKLGMSVNPLFGLQSANGSEVMSFLAALVLIGTFWIALKVPRLARSWVTGNGTVSGAARMFNLGGRGLAMTGHPAGVAAGRAMGGGADGSVGMSNRWSEFTGASSHAPLPPVRSPQQIGAGAAAAAAAQAGRTGQKTPADRQLERDNVEARRKRERESGGGFDETSEARFQAHEPLGLPAGTNVERDPAPAPSPASSDEPVHTARDGAGGIVYEIHDPPADEQVRRGERADGYAGRVADTWDEQRSRFTPTAPAPTSAPRRAPSPARVRDTATFLSRTTGDPEGAPAAASRPVGIGGSRVRAAGATASAPSGAPAARRWTSAAKAKAQIAAPAEKPRERPAGVDTSDYERL